MAEIYILLLASVLGYLVTIPIDLRKQRLSTILGTMALAWWYTQVLPRGYPTIVNIDKFILSLVPLVLFAVLYAPKIAWFGALAFQNFICPLNWTPLQEEEISLKEIRNWIDQDQYRVALRKLDGLFRKRKASYAAAILHAQLATHLHQFAKAKRTLLWLMRYAQTDPQRHAAMLLFQEVEKAIANQHQEGRELLRLNPT